LFEAQFELHKTHLASWRKLSCNCPYAIRPQPCLLALEEQMLVTQAFFNEQTHEKSGQETYPTQKESSAFRTETF